MDVTLRRMTPDEFAARQREIAEEYAREQVAAGRWEEDGAVERAKRENAERLPRGLDTPRMLLLRGLDRQGAAVGRVWVGLDHPRGAPGVAFLYDIEVVPARRGEGLGRALLAGAEAAARSAGADALELNVFGGNAAAIRLYASSGYEVATMQMRKPL